MLVYSLRPNFSSCKIKNTTSQRTSTVCVISQQVVQLAWAVWHKFKMHLKQSYVSNVSSTCCTADTSSSRIIFISPINRQKLTLLSTCNNNAYLSFFSNAKSAGSDPRILYYFLSKTQMLLRFPFDDTPTSCLVKARFHTNNNITGGAAVANVFYRNAALSTFKFLFWCGLKHLTADLTVEHLLREVVFRQRARKKQIVWAKSFVWK